LLVALPGPLLAIAEIVGSRRKAGPRPVGGGAGPGPVGAEEGPVLVEDGDLFRKAVGEGELGLQIRGGEPNAERKQRRDVGAGLEAIRVPIRLLRLAFRRARKS